MITDKQVKAFYNSMAWLRLRQVKLSLNPLCEACQMSGIITSATDVHHMRPVRLFWDDRFDLKYLLSLCASCHGDIEMEVREQEKAKVYGG